MTKKGFTFVNTSINNYLHHKGQKCKISTQLDAFLNVVFGLVCFGKFFSMFMVEKCDNVQLVKTQYPKTRFLVTLSSFF